MHTETPGNFEVIDPMDVRRQYWEVTSYVNEMSRLARHYAHRADPKGKRMHAFYRAELIDSRHTLNTLKGIL